MGQVLHGSATTTEAIRRAIQNSQESLRALSARDIQVVIPPKSNRKVQRECDYALYCERNLVENFFKTIKHFRGIATRYEKTARNFLAGVHLVCALVWLK
jgi:transposase